MDFLLDPIEIGSDFLDSVDNSLKITCNTGFRCQTGTVEPFSMSDDLDLAL